MRFYSATVVVVPAACVSSSSKNEAEDASGVHEDVAQTLPSTPSRVVGLMSLPQVFGDYPCDTYTPSEIGLYAELGSSRPLGAIYVSQPWTRRYRSRPVR